MTADIRKIRSRGLNSQDLESHDLEPADARDAGREPVVLRRLATSNDNAHATWSPLRSEMSAGEDVSTTGSVTPAMLVGEGLRARRRGPLVTRWIGFAAHRRENQARTDRMRDLHGETASGRSGR